MASRSIICRSRRLRQIIDLRDIDKSQYFAITEFDNCFIIRSPSLFLYLNHSLTAHHFFTESVVTTTHEQNIICSKSHLDSTTHEQTIICRQLFAGHVVGSRPMKRKKKMHRMIIVFICMLMLKVFFILVGLHTQVENIPKVTEIVEGSGALFQTQTYFTFISFRLFLFKYHTLLQYLHNIFIDRYWQ